MSEISNLPSPERATRYRAQAHELCAKAADYPDDIRAAFFRIAGYWEKLALEAEAKQAGVIRHAVHKSSGPGGSLAASRLSE